MEVNTQDFREQIAVYLQLVKTGETITLVEDDEPVARIIPIKQTLESQINVLQEAGLVASNSQFNKRGVMLRACAEQRRSILRSIPFSWKIRGRRDASLRSA